MNPPEKKIKTLAVPAESETEEDGEMIPRTVSEDGDDYDGEILDYEDYDDDDEDDDEDYSGEHIVVAGDPVTQQAGFDDYDDEKRLKIVDDNEVRIFLLYVCCTTCF